MDSREHLSPEQESIACNIQDAAQKRQRAQEVATLFNSANHIREIADGYEYSFPSDSVWGNRLLEFILFEKECCPFFTFELIFEPHHGALRLRLRGPEGVKEGLALFPSPDGN